MGNSRSLSSDNERQIKWLLDSRPANDGLAQVDLDRFWSDHQIAAANPFGPNIPQVPLGIFMSGECVFAELGIAEDYWRYEHDEPWRLELNKAYNDLSERIVGRRLLSEQPIDPSLCWPATRTLADIFEAENVWVPGTWSWWLKESAHSEGELTALLDRVDVRLDNLRSFVLPENWDDERERLTALGKQVPLYRGQRGPVTFATSIFGVENLIYLILDNPDLAARFRDTILSAMLALAGVFDVEAGYCAEPTQRGFWFADDNCCLLKPGMYEFFGFPILQAIFSKYSPEPGDARFQHSDSAMGHLLPILGRLNMTAVNFGPTVMVDEIRAHLPGAVINGQLAPFTFSRDEEEGIIAEFLRDFEMARERRGLVFATAGSINNGSRLTGMRLIMSAIQHFGRYNG